MTVNRREFIQGAGFAMIAGTALPLAAAASPATPQRIQRIGILGESNPIGWMVRTAAVDIECRWADDRREKLADLAAELVALDVDVIVAAGARAARAVRNATKAIPIVFVSGEDPVKVGLVASLAKPGGNATGLWVVSDLEIARQRVQVLRDAVPGLRRMAVLANPANPSHDAAFESIRDLAESHAVEARLVKARASVDLPGVVATMKGERAGGVLVLPDALFAVHARRLVSLAAASRLPVVYGARSFAEAGGLMALYGDTAEVIRRTTAMVARVLAGSGPATLPVESLPHLELTVNAATARALGLALPRSLLARADAVIGARA